MSDKVKGILCACISAATFGLIPLFANTAMIDGMNNDTILAYRFTFASVAYLVYLIFKKKNLSVTKSQTIELFLAGVGGYGITSFFLFLSYRYIPTGVATAIHYFYPVVVAILMALIYKVKLNFITKVAIFTATLGVGLLSWTKGEIQPIGLIFLFISVLSYAIYIVALNRKTLRELDSDVLTFWVICLSAIFYICLSLVRGTLTITADPKFVMNMFLLGVISTVISARMMVAAVRYIGSVNSSILGTLEPITALLTGIFVFHESFTFQNAIGFIIVTISVVLVVVYSNKNVNLDFFKKNNYFRKRF